MPLIRCKEQSRQTLEEFYQEFIPDMVNKFADIGTPMLKVIKLLNDTFKETTIYGLTSHATLLLLNKDSSLCPKFVAISGLQLSTDGQRNEFYIEYLMTLDKQPWTNATVKGTVTNLDELKKHIIISMTESKGWADSEELRKLYNDLNA